MRKIILLTTLALTCCTPDKNQKQTTALEIATANHEFDAYLDLLPSIALPYETTCARCCKSFSFNDSVAIVKEFTPEGARIVGLLSRSDERAIILVTYPGDMLIPSVIVFDSTGRLINEMKFMTGFCGEDPDVHEEQFFRINPDLSFVEIDTSYQMKNDTTSFSVMRKDFTVNERGQIVEVKQR